MAGEAKKTVAKKAPAKKTAAKKTAAKKTVAKKAAAPKAQAVSVSDKVLMQVNPLQNNGSPEAFGFVVGVDTRGTPTMVDVKVLLNDAENLLLRSVPLLSKAEAKKDDAPTPHAVKA